MLEIFLFGEPRIVYSGREHAFVAPPKAMPLLAYLLLHRHAILHREAVAQALWPDAPDEEARANLRRHIHYIRKALPGGEWILTRNQTVQWNPHAPFRLDVAEFEQQSRIDALRMFAVQLYTGDLLARYTDEEWLIFERERLRNLQLRTLTAIIHDADELHDAPAVERYAQLLLAFDPWREDAIRALMRARATRGDRSGALAEFERFRERLDDEMAMAPMPETIALFVELTESGAEVSGAPPASDDASHPLVGRHGEIETLYRQFKRAAGGQGTVALIGGEAGIGKTRLLQALAAKVRADGGTVLCGRASASVDAPYEAIADALQSGGMQLNSLGPGLLNNSGQRAVLFSSVAAALERISAESPVLLALEDLHWSTADTIALVEFLVRRLRQTPTFIVATYREEEVPAQHPLRTLRRLLGATPGFNHLVLNALSSEAIAELLRVTAPDADDVLAAEIYARSQGNAFFATELIDHVVRHGFVDVPQSIKQLTADRIGRLSAAASQLARTLCIAGAAIGFELMSELTLLPESQLTVVLRELVQGRIIHEDAEGRAYRFVHEIVRQALYEMAPETDRRQAHAHVARVLAATFGDMPRYANAIAYHEERAGMREPAASRYVTAGQYAFSVAANAEAEASARRALELSESAAIRYEAFLILDNVYNRTRNREKNLEVLDEMDELVRRAPGEVDGYRATRARIAYCIHTDQIEALPALIEQYAAEIPDDPLWQARRHFFESAYHFQCTNESEAFASTYEALRLYREAGNAFGQLYCHIRLLELCDRHGRPFGELLDAARELAVEVDSHDASYLLAFAETKLFLHIDRSLAQYAALRMLEIGELLADPLRIGVAHTFLGGIAIYRFEIQESQMHLASAEELIAQSGRAIDRVRLLRFRALLAGCIADFDSALADSESAIALARNAKTYELLHIITGNTMQYLRYTGDHERAIELGESTIALFKNRRIDFRFGHIEFGLAESYFERGERERALELAHYCYDWLVKRGFTVNRSIVSAWLALTYARMGDVQRARPFIDAYLDAMDAATLEGYMPQDTAWRVAQALHICGDEPRARMLLERAMDTLSQRIGALADEESRRRYLHFWVNQQIVRAHSEDYWPPVSAALRSAMV